MMMKVRDRASAEERRKFSTILGVKTTIQQAMDMESRMPERAVMSMAEGPLEGDIVVGRDEELVRSCSLRLGRTGSEEGMRGRKVNGLAGRSESWVYYCKAKLCLYSGLPTK